MKANRILTTCTTLLSLLTICFIGLGIYYSNIIISPPKCSLSNIPQDWKINKYNPQDYGLEYENISFQTKDNLTLKGWYIPCKKDDKKAISSGWTILITKIETSPARQYCCEFPIEVRKAPKNNTRIHLITTGYKDSEQSTAFALVG